MVRTSLKGTATRSALQIAEEGEMLGGSVGGIAGSETFGWSISVPARYAAGAIELLADVVQHPTLNEDALDTERSIAMADVVALRDDMYRYPMRLANAGGVRRPSVRDSDERHGGNARTRRRRCHSRVASRARAVVGVGDRRRGRRGSR